MSLWLNLALFDGHTCCMQQQLLAFSK